MNPIRWLTGRRTSEREVVDITSRKHKEDPYPFYARMRAEEPVKPITLPDGRAAFLVARYDDVAAILKDERFVKDKRNAVASKQPWMPAMFRPLMENMLDLDPPNHTRLRALVHKAFTPRLVEQMRPRVEALADGILDALHGRDGFELIRDYALPIPTAIITDMLGVPDRDRQRFHRWTRAIVSANPSGPGMLLVAPYVWAFLRFIRRLIRSKRSSPGDDLLSALVRAEEVGDQLSENELVAMAFLLLVAGHETTVNLIGNGLLALLEHPEQLERLRSDPAIIKPAVEELLRWLSFAGSAPVWSSSLDSPSSSRPFIPMRLAVRRLGALRGPFWQPWLSERSSLTNSGCSLRWAASIDDWAWCRIASWRGTSAFTLSGRAWFCQAICSREA